MSPADSAVDGGPLIFIIAGEASGDALGGRVMAALRRRRGDRIRFAGVGGEAMAAQGLESLFPMTDLSVMGLAEVLPSVPRIWLRLRQTRAAARRMRPDALLTIDAPGFNFRLARRLAGQGFPLIHMVAPTVWAWRPGRAREIARFLDHLLVLLPFEPPYFEAEGLACTFIGHPALEDRTDADGDGLRRRHGIPADAPLLAVFPGSRGGEVSRLLPVFGATLERLKADVPGLHAITSTVPGVRERVEAAISTWPVPTVLTTDRDDHAAAMAAADAALAASGTITMELAWARTPMVAAYRMSPLTRAIVRRLIRVRYMTLINLVLDEKAIPEFVQDRCTPDALAAACRELLVDPRARAAQIEALERGLAIMTLTGATPSERASDAILETIGVDAVSEACDNDNQRPR